MSRDITIVADENLRGKGRFLEPLGKVVTAAGRAIDAAMLEHADALIVRSVTQVDAALLAKADKLRFVGSATAGLDHIDQAALDKRGIVFSAAPGSNANSVVEYVLAAIATHGNTLERLLDGAKLGIVGQGHVGRLLASRLTALGIDHRSYDPWLDASSSLQDVLACEVISLHPSLHRREPWPSYHLLGAAQLAQLRDDVLLINASRGAVLDNPALSTWLRQHPNAGAVLDVWEGEPVPNRALLQQAFIATPHIAGYALDAKLKATEQLAAKLCELFSLSRREKTDGADVQPPLLLQTAEPAQMLRALLTARYDICRDHQRFVAMCRDAQGREALAAGFDALRKHYPERRELAGANVVVECETGCRLAKALGAVVC